MYIHLYEVLCVRANDVWCRWDGRRTYSGKWKSLKCHFRCNVWNMNVILMRARFISSYLYFDVIQFSRTPKPTARPRENIHSPRRSVCMGLHVSGFFSAFFFFARQNLRCVVIGWFVYSHLDDDVLQFMVSIWSLSAASGTSGVLFHTIFVLDGPMIPAQFPNYHHWHTHTHPLPAITVLIIILILLTAANLHKILI